MTAFGKSVRLYLKDGSVTGFKALLVLVQGLLN
jgi:hypothetical protein